MDRWIKNLLRAVPERAQIMIIAPGANGGSYRGLDRSVAASLVPRRALRPDQGTESGSYYRLAPATSKAVGGADLLRHLRWVTALLDYDGTGVDTGIVRPL